VVQLAAVGAGRGSPEVSTEIPGLAFDEGFLWSAEILAAQGRRPEDVSVEEITWLKKLQLGLDKTVATSLTSNDCWSRTTKPSGSDGDRDIAAAS